MSLYDFGGTSTHDMPAIYTSIRNASKLGSRTYLAINHESQDILNAIERQDPTVSGTLPHSLPIGISMLDCASHLVDEFGVGHGDFEVWILLIARETVQILSHDHLHGMYSRLVLGNLRFQEDLVSFAIMWSKRIGSCNIKVVEEVGDVKHDRMAGLRGSQSVCGGLAEFLNKPP